MKIPVTLLLVILNFQVIAQKKPEVTIIGTVHSFLEEYQSLQSIDETIKFIKDLNPDIICIESIPVSDTLSLKEVLPKTMKKADHLRDTLKQEGYYLNNSKPLLNDSTGNLAFWKSSSSNKKLIDGAVYYANYDFWNAYYQWFQVLASTDSLGYFSEYNKNQTRTEFGLMTFPAAIALRKNHLYGIDYRVGEQKFLASNRIVMKKLFFRLKWKPILVYLKAKKKYKKAEKKGKLIEYINGDEFQNSFSQLIVDLPQKLPKTEEAQFVAEYWLNRNEIMAERIINTAKEQKAETVLLMIGSAHVAPIKAFLEKKGHMVITYGQIINQKK